MSPRFTGRWMSTARKLACHGGKAASAGGWDWGSLRCPVASRQLLDLLYKDQFDWHDERQRADYLRAWVRRDPDIDSMGWLAPDSAGHPPEDAGNSRGLLPGRQRAVREDQGKFAYAGPARVACGC